MGVVIVMIGYVFKRTGKTHKKKLGFMKAKSAEIVVIDTLNHIHTLSHHSGKVEEYIRDKYGTLPHGEKASAGDVPYALSKALTHAHFYTSYTGRYDHIHRTFEDAQKWNILLQLMSVIPALREGIRDTRKFGDRTYALLEEIRKEYGEPVFFYILGKEAKKYGNIVSLPADKDPREGYIMPGFEQLKKNPALQEKFINAFIQAHVLPTAYRSRLRNYLQLAIDSAEELARFLGREGKYSIRPEQFQEFEKFNKFIEMVMEYEFSARPREITKQKAERQRKRRIVRPEEILASQLSEFEEEETPAPKFPEAKKAVEGRILPEVLSIAKALEFSDFSEKAMRKAEKELLKMIDRFIEEEDAAALFHAVKLLRLVQKGEVEEIKRFGG